MRNTHNTSERFEYLVKMRNDILSRKQKIFSTIYFGIPQFFETGGKAPPFYNDGGRYNQNIKEIYWYGKKYRSDLII